MFNTLGTQCIKDNEILPNFIKPLNLEGEKVIKQDVFLGGVTMSFF